ncbi:hypothetical protein Vadar_030977 [Vaccinium darrowii]|uniref:Uncharacterized protein n=1 Tax=Vaccinium darrowii TaxID=229202 RepID=A0ACB7YA93_9ERIC|nr:hypothetical protein Vadar_030977 [Vaccinium darrowii]
MKTFLFLSLVDSFQGKGEEEFHPDQNQDNKIGQVSLVLTIESAEAKFKEVMTSYEAIKTERKTTISGLATPVIEISSGSDSSDSEGFSPRVVRADLDRILAEIFARRNPCRILVTMDHNFEKPLNMPPLQAVPPSPKRSSPENLDDFIDDSEATQSDNRSEWEPSGEFEEEASNPSSSADTTSDVDISAAIERTIVAEIDEGGDLSGEVPNPNYAEVPVPLSAEHSGGNASENQEGATSLKKKKKETSGKELIYGPDHVNVPLMAVTEAPGPITRELRRLWSKEREDALRAIPDRTAPIILSYRPTYRHFLKKKTKKRKGGNTADSSAGPSKRGKATVISESERIIIEELPVEDLRGKERDPVDRVSPDPFATEPEMAPPKLDLAKILEEQAVKKKKVVKSRPVSAKVVAEKVSIPLEPTPFESDAPVEKQTSSRSKTTSGEGRSQKRGRQMVDWEGVEFVDSLGSDMPKENDPHPFSPILINEEGDLLKDTDSIDANPRLAMSLLPAVALKKDLENVPKQLGENLFHLPYHLMKTLALNDQTRRYKTRAEAAQQKAVQAEEDEGSAKARLIEVERMLEEERARHREELERFKKEQEEKLQALDTEAYGRGYLAAGKDYAQDIFKLVQKGRSEGRDEGFESGYLTGMEAAKVPAEDPRRKVPARLPFADELSDDSPEEENQVEDEQS